MVDGAWVERKRARAVRRDFMEGVDGWMGHGWMSEEEERTSSLMTHDP
jgi:hypothetical protein